MSRQTDDIGKKLPKKYMEQTIGPLFPAAQFNILDVCMCEKGGTVN